MIRTLYTVNRNMNILQKKQENTNANLANINTPGYKFQNIIESTMETHGLINYSGGSKNNRRQELGAFVFGNQIDSIYKNFDQGSLYETNQSTDFAIIGNGFFTIQMEDGQVAYTRNGNFKVSDDNQLITMEGRNVLGANGGPIYVDDGYNIDFLITDFNDYANLNSLGETIFTSNEGFQIQGQVKQGFLEMSNVDMVDEMVKMIEISRNFEANQKLLHAADETLSKAVNEIGRV